MKKESKAFLAMTVLYLLGLYLSCSLFSQSFNIYCFPKDVRCLFCVLGFIIFFLGGLLTMLTQLAKD